MNHLSHRQMSESFLTAAFLSISGGLQDAYTYLFRGKVFANAQTGNIVLLSACVVDRNWYQAAHYLIPLLFFALGIAAAEWVRLKYQRIERLHWRQLVVLSEIILLFAVGIFPGTAESVCQCLSILFMRHAGSDIPQGQRICLCQHHVYRQSPKLYGISVRLCQNAR
mgnify:CR=1 FL=1